MTGTQIAKTKRQTPEYKGMIKAITIQMKNLKKQGLEFDHLATCPDTYALFLKIKYN